MFRYCVKCQKEYDFAPTLVSGKEDLICPGCGSIIPKNSRKIVSHADMEETEEKIGGLFSKLFHLSYIYYAVLSCVGIGLYFMHFSMALYVITGLMLFTFILQYFVGFLVFVKGFYLFAAWGCNRVCFTPYN